MPEYLKGRRDDLEAYETLMAGAADRARRTLPEELFDDRGAVQAKINEQLEKEGWPINARYPEKVFAIRRVRNVQNALGAMVRFGMESNCYSGIYPIPTDLDRAIVREQAIKDTDSAADKVD